MIDVRQLFLEEFNVSLIDLDKAVIFQKKYGGRLEHILVNMGALSEDMLPEYYAKVLGVQLLSNERLQSIDIAELKKLNVNEAFINFNWFAIAQTNNEQDYLVIASDPFSAEANEYISQNELNIELLVASEEQIQALKQQYVQLGTESLVSSEELSDVEEDRLRELAGEAPTVNLLNSLISRALKARASDMHLEPIGNRYRVRFRIDGVLKEADWIPPRMRLPVASRLKILSGMDIAEKRRPQDGKIGMKISNEDLDIRVSVLPLHDGESIVMRFLRQDAISYSMEMLGLSKDIEKNIREDIEKTAGVILLTGPTGSGKTTSLYTFLNAINDETVKIITLEDPVEYQLEGINQVQIQSSIGFDFSAGLRSIVRQDPDVIMLGEIRDKETAQIAMQSALTGHLVFSTVHTNDASSAYTRLLDLGAEEYLLNAAIVSIIAQRLVRKLCPHCSQPDENQQQSIAKYGLQALADAYGTDIQLHKAVGCDQCSNTGYRGRVGIIEYLRCDDAIKALPKDENFPSHAVRLNQQRGGRTLMQDGFIKAINGQTTVEEVIRVAG
ncbi:type II secretion protein [Shewanella sairae]|uniref:Type II secretion protein n=1 Tax=Shewanella sairae TaxID=190310 RepID=A0ABQ4PNA1_9GAMM|nr:GspE/PulE family protein [Shewanella sairae]MCL1131413.1 GspE/PulE family protein [Shewanella sairae]GIU49889.1 type II secretion protein [Shewanella sairae]